MDWSFMAGPVSSVIGGLFGQSSAREAAEAQFQNQLKLMEKQHEYQVSDYKHRYQWSTQDMRDAGLNPILAATSGIGGNISGVSAGNAAMAQTPDFGSMLGNAVNSALSTKNQREVALKGLELQDRATAVEERKLDVEALRAETDWWRAWNDIDIKGKEFDLKSADVKFHQELAREMQDFYMDTRLQELGAQIKHMAAQDANLAAMSEAALRNASVQEILANLAVENGISHRALEAAQAIFTGNQSEYLRKQGDTEEARQELMRAQKSYTEFLETVGPIKTATDLMSGILSVAIGAKVGYGLYNDIFPTSGPKIGF